MKQSVWTGKTPSNPQAFITKGKQRVKQNQGLVFLNDGDEYQIELFNPTQNHILAKIKIDNTFLSGGGIVLRPGERVFLERFLDSNNKFVFRTYEVGQEAVNVGAIDKNGYVEIQFFNEWKQTNYWNGGSTYTITQNGYGPYNITTNTTNSAPYLGNATFTTSGTSTALYTNSLSSNTLAGPNIRTFADKGSAKVETGTTEKGSQSNQKFTQSDKDFYSYSFHNVVWQILPLSTKQYHKEDLGILYCGECGAKRKKDSHKFCPHCGTKF